MTNKINLGRRRELLAMTAFGRHVIVSDPVTFKNIHHGEHGRFAPVDVASDQDQDPLITITPTDRTLERAFNAVTSPSDFVISDMTTGSVRLIAASKYSPAHM